MASRTISESVESQLLALGTYTSTANGWRSLSTASYRSSSTDSDVTVEVPEIIDSIETLKFVGFTDEAAEQIWRAFSALREEWPDMASMIHIAKAHVRRGSDAFEATHDWDAAMTTMGIGPNLRACILTPGYENIRLGRSAMEWVIETIEDRYGFLRSLGTWITTPQHGRQRPTTIESLDSSNLGRSQTPVGPASRAKLPTLRTFEHPSQPHVRLLTDVLPVGEDEVLLVKGGSLTRLNQAQSQGTNRLASQFSAPPSDLSQRPAYYFSKQLEVARRYAMWARVRNNDIVPVGILYLVIPKALLSDAVEIVGSAFKEFLWKNRLGLNLPAHLQYYDQAPALIGPIIWKSTLSIADLEAHGEDWQLLTPLRLHHGESATQYCVDSSSLIDRMNEHGRICVTAYEDPSGK